MIPGAVANIDFREVSQTILCADVGMPGSQYESSGVSKNQLHSMSGRWRESSVACLLPAPSSTSSSSFESLSELPLLHGSSLLVISLFCKLSCSASYRCSCNSAGTGRGQESQCITSINNLPVTLCACRLFAVGLQPGAQRLPGWARAARLRLPPAHASRPSSLCTSDLDPAPLWPP